MTWWMFALLSGAGLAFRNIFYKIGSQNADAGLSAVVLSLAMAATAVTYFIVQRLSTNQPIALALNTTNILFSAFAGISLAAANIFLAHAYKAGGMASVVGILQNALAISLTIAVGLTVLGEGVKPTQLLGILIAFVGIFLIIKS